MSGRVKRSESCRLPQWQVSVEICQHSPFSVRPIATVSRGRLVDSSDSEVDWLVVVRPSETVSVPDLLGTAADHVAEVSYRVSVGIEFPVNCVIIEGMVPPPDVDLPVVRQLETEALLLTLPDRKAIRTVPGDRRTRQIRSDSPLVSLPLMDFLDLHQRLRDASPDELGVVEPAAPIITYGLSALLTDDFPLYSSVAPEPLYLLGGGGDRTHRYRKVEILKV